MQLLKISDTYNLELGKLMLRFSAETLPPTICAMFSKKCNTNYSLRSQNKNNLDVPSARINQKQRSIGCRGPVLWNTLPGQFKTMSSKLFNREYITYTLEKYGR